MRWNLERTPAYLSGVAQHAACLLHTPSPMSPYAFGRTMVRLAIPLILTAGVLGAQQSPPPVATAVPSAVVLPASAADTSETLVVARARDTVRSEKDRLLGERRDAETRWTTLRCNARHP